MKNHVQIKCAMLLVLVLLLAASPLAAGQWTQTDWSGGETTEVVTGTTTKYRTGENENVLTAGKIILENKPTAIVNSFPTASGMSAGFIDNDNVLTSNDLYAKGTGVAGWVDHVVISEVYYDTAEGNDNSEFVELYNPTSSDVNLNGWALLESTTTRITFGSEDVIRAYKHLLIVRDKWATVWPAGWPTPDNTVTFALSNTGDNVTLKNASGDVVDLVGWEGSVIYEGTAHPGVVDNSIERYSGPGQTHNSTKGNGFDSDNNAYDFFKNSAASPNHANPENKDNAAEHPGWLTEGDKIWAGGFATGTGTITKVELKVEYHVSAAWTNDNLFIKYSLDGGATFGATSLMIGAPSSTSDTTATVDVTADRAWSWTDITNLRIYVIYDICGTSDGKDVYIDAIWVDVTRTSPYAPFAYLESSVFDAGANADWKTVTWNASVPSQAGPDNIKVYLRSDSDNDLSGKTWCKHDNNTENTSLDNNRYVQYRVELHTDNENVTPEFLDITINYNTFSVRASPTEVTVVRGGTKKDTTVTIKLLAGTVGTVALSGSWVGGEPSGVDATFDPTSVDLGALNVGENKTSTLSFKAKDTASTGNFTFRIKGDASGLINTYDITVKIATFDYRVDANPESLSMMRVETKTSTITVKAVEGEQSTVTLEGSWVGYEAGKGPTGVTASLSKTSGIPNYESTLTVSTGTNAEGGSFLYRVTATGGGVSKHADVRVTVNVELTLTLTTDKDSYKKGDTIKISGTAVNPKGEKVENGTATIQLKFLENVIRQDNVKITNGSFSDNYQISYADSDGTWTVKVTAVDNLKNTGEASKNITVGTPGNVLYYNTSITITTGYIYSRGDRIEISVEVKDNGGAPVENIYIYLKLPSGRSIPLRKLSPGVYVAENSLGWDEPTGLCKIVVEGEKVVGNVIMAAAGEAYIEIKTAVLELSLLSPGNRVEVGETVMIKVKVLYPNQGGPVEGAVVTVTTPTGENLTLAHEGSGIYSKTYTVASKDVGSWSLAAAASDAYGNSFSKTVGTIEVATMGPSRIVTTYWWAFLAMFAAVGVASAYITRRTILVRRLKGVRREIREIPKLKKEVMIKYFREGSIERDTYDEMMDKHDMRLGELRKQEELLRAKVEKKIKAKKARGKKKRR